MPPLQKRRLWFQSGFFLLFVLAPSLDIFRFDLTQGHFIFFGAPWTLGIDAFIRGEIGPLEVSLNLLLRGFLPLLLAGGGLIWIAWRYGRLYCGWLCPHFSVVEMINKPMQRAGGKPSLWEKEPLPVRQPDGRLLRPNPHYWAVVIPAALAVQKNNPLGGVLHWVEGDCALPVVSGRKQQPGCFSPAILETMHARDKS